MHDVCWLVRGIDPLTAGVAGGSDSSSASGSASGSGVNGSGGTDEIAAAASSRPRFVCLKDPVDFRSHPVNALVTTIIDRYVEKHTLSIPPLTHPVNALVTTIIDRYVEYCTLSTHLLTHSLTYP